MHRYSVLQLGAQRPNGVDGVDALDTASHTKAVIMMTQMVRLFLLEGVVQKFLKRFFFYL